MNFRNTLAVFAAFLLGIASSESLALGECDDLDEKERLVLNIYLNNVDPCSSDAAEERGLDELRVDDQTDSVETSKKPASSIIMRLRASPEKSTMSVANFARSQMYEAVNGSAAIGDANATLDLLPTIIAQLSNVVDTVELDGRQEDDSQNLDLAFNLPICFNGLAGNCSQIAVKFNDEPMVSDMVVQAIPEVDREAFRSTTNRSLNTGDDFTVRFTYNLQGRIGSRYWGRSPDLYLSELAALRSILRMQNVKNAVEFQGIVPDGSLSESAILDINDRAEEASEKTVTQIAADLINNQPQFSVSAYYSGKDDLVGQDEARVSISYELPLGKNLNRFINNNRGACKNPLRAFSLSRSNLIGVSHRNILPTSLSCAEALTEYAKSQQNTGKNSLRASFSLEYLDRQRSNFMLNEPGVAIDLPSSTSWIVKLGLGKRFGSTRALGPSSLNFDASYEDVSDDDMRNDRFLGQLTWSFKVGSATVPISLIYANRPEFDLVEVDQQLSANIGIRYDLAQFGTK